MGQTPNSSPYHADILLVTVTELETMAVRKLFPNKLKHFIDDNTYYELGEVGEARVFLVRSEVGANGPGGAFATIDEGISFLSPSIVIMVGTAFGVASEGQNIGDILVSEQIIEIEQVVSGPKGEPIIISRGDKALASPRLIKRFKDGALEWREANEVARVRFGQICSGEKLIQSQDLRDQLQSLGSRVIGGELKGVGLYAAAQANKVDWILVKAIADWADGKKVPDQEKNQLLAADNAARFAIYVIQQGGLITENKQGTRQQYEIQQEVPVAAQPASVEARDILQRKTEANEFDVFLCYNAQDLPEVKKIAMALKERGIRPWLDQWEVPPGRPWQRVLERQIRTIKSAAVFVGQNDLGPWQRTEMDAFLRQIVRLGNSVIPVLLPGASEKLQLPLFLEGMTWVDFRRPTPDPLTQLIWGITVERPSKYSIGGSEIAVSGVRDIYGSSAEADIRADITEIRLAINDPSYYNYQQLAPAIIRRLGATRFQMIHSPDFERDSVWEISLPPLGLRLRTGKAIFFLRRGIETSGLYDRLIEIKNTRDAEFLIVVDSIDIKQSPPRVTSDMVRLHPPLLEELIKAPSEEIVAWLGRLIASQVRNFERLIPFRTEGSADLSIFFGRSYELDRLTGRTARGGVIIGAHKSGKSSLLTRIGERLRRDKYVVGGPYTIRSENINTFLLDTLHLEDFQQLHFDLPATIDPEVWSTLLRDQHKKGKRLVLLLDEVDNLLKADAENDYKLGSEMRALQYDGLCKFYIAGHNQLREAITLEGKPFRNFAEEITLTGLDEEAAIRLIREPIGAIGFKVSKRQAKQIYEGTAGVAVLVQGFCRRLLLKIHSHGERNSEVEDALIQKIERNPDYLNMVYEYFKYAQTATSQAITLIVSCLSEATSQDIIQGFGKYGVLLPWSKLEHSLKFLLKFGVLQELEDGHFSVSSKYLRKAIEIYLRDTDALLAELLEKSQREQ